MARERGQPDSQAFTQLFGNKKLQKEYTKAEIKINPNGQGSGSLWPSKYHVVYPLFAHFVRTFQLSNALEGGIGRGHGIQNEPD